MAKLASIKDFQDLRDLIVIDLDGHKYTIVICAGTACQASGSNEIIRSAKRYILKKHYRLPWILRNGSIYSH